MASRITIELNTCQGMASCAMAAPDVFGIDENDGKSVVLQDTPADIEQAVRAARLCPTGAITISHG